eukprot:6017145-Prymnesium_polylepis.3
MNNKSLPRLRRRHASANPPWVACSGGSGAPLALPSTPEGYLHASPSPAHHVPLSQPEHKLSQSSSLPAHLPALYRLVL